jgi:CheY-like chemotaxis protein
MSTVLVLDDEERYRAHLRICLERQGFTTLVADTVETARKLMQENPIDLIVVDIRLPGAVDGLAFADWARERNRDLSIVVITGYSSPEYEAHSRELGAAAYLEKPFDPKDLETHVQRELERRKLLREIHRLEQELAAAASVALFAIACISPDGRILYASDRARLLLDRIADPRLPRPLQAVDANLLARIAAVAGERDGAATLFQRDGQAGHLHAFARRTHWNEQAVLAVVLVEGDWRVGSIVDERWMEILLAAAGARIAAGV